MTRRPKSLPKIGSVWVDKSGYDPGRRIRITGYLPVGVEKPDGVEAQVLTSVRRRFVMMSLRDLRDLYDPEEAA